VDLTVRDLTPADVPAWNALMAQVALTDGTGEHYDEGDLEEELANPVLEPGDYVGAFDGNDLVAYVEVLGRQSSEECLKIGTGGATRPDRRGEGIGTLMVGRMLARADEIHRARRPHGPARVMARGLSTDTAQESLLAATGLAPERWSFGMRVDLATADLAPQPLPDGLVLGRYEDALSHAMLDAHNDAFRDHWGFTAWTGAEWVQWVTGSRSFRPSLCRVVTTADEPDRVVAYVQTAEYVANQEATGRREAYVGKVGVRRSHRGRGVATSLLQHCLVAYRDAGFDEASLDVDSGNPTGALGVYERAGFAVDRRWTHFVKVLPALSRPDR